MSEDRRQASAVRRLGIDCDVDEFDRTIGHEQSERRERVDDHAGLQHHACAIHARQIRRKLVPVGSEALDSIGKFIEQKVVSRRDTAGPAFVGELAVSASKNVSVTRTRRRVTSERRLQLAWPRLR